MGKIIGLIGIIVVIGGGIYWYISQSDANKDTHLSAPDSTEQTRESSENKGVIASIKDAMTSGAAMSCAYTMDQQDKTYESTVFVQGEKFRADVSVSGMNTHVLFDGNDQYMWNDGSPSGFKMSKACIEEMNALAPKSTPPADIKTPTLQDAKAAFELAKNVKCSPSGILDLSVPKDVTFTDQCAQLKESMKMMEKYQSQMPAR